MAFWTLTISGKASLWGNKLVYSNSPRVSNNQFETLHRCHKHIEDVHVSFCRQENNFSQNYGIFYLDNFDIRFQ